MNGATAKTANEFSRIPIRFEAPVACAVQIHPTNLPISPRTVFVDINGVRASRGVSADKVKELAEAGKLLWVFNLGRANSGAGKHDLRFWLPEVFNPAAVAHFNLEDVISNILPARRQAFNGSEIGQWFLVSRPTVRRISSECGGTILNKRFLRVSRERLAGYLRKCWMGGAK